MDTEQLKQLQDIHVTAWNEKDATKRNELLKKIYTDDVKMYDKDFIFDGLDAVSNFIGQLIATNPAFNFAAAKSIEGLENSARLSGHIQTSGGLLNSMDFFLLKDGKVNHLYAFMEPAV